MSAEIPICPHCGRPAPVAPGGVHKRCAERDERQRDPIARAYHAILDTYIREFRDARGETPLIFAADRGAIKRIAVEMGPERGPEIVRLAFAHPFWGSRVTIQMIARDPSRFLGSR